MSAIDKGAEIEGRFAFIKQGRIDDGKQASDALQKTYRDEFHLSPLDAVAAVTYTKGLHLTLDEYKDKQVLDAGSGMGNLKNTLKGMNIPSNVVNLDDAKTWGTRNVDVVGEVEHAPFADNTFDITVANYVFPWTLDETVNPEFMSDQLKELIRVTKKGGQIKYRPLRMFRSGIGNKPQEIMDNIYQKTLETLEIVHKENPDMKVQITRAIEDDGISYDEILEITK